MIVFDVDGTILPGTSCERLFVRYLRDRKVLGPRNFVNFCIGAFRLMPFGLAYMAKANKGYLGGLKIDEMDTIATEFFGREVAPKISQAAISRIKEHQGRGERVILLSGMPNFLLTNFSGLLNVPEHYGSVLETADGCYTGLTSNPFPLGMGKVHTLQRILDRAENVEISWSDIVFYGDHWLDRFLFEEVGHPVTVNPGPRLMRLAIAKGWKVERWE